MEQDMSNQNAAALVNSIRAEFPDSFRIEVYVLMSGGNALMVHSGAAALLKPAPFLQVLTAPGQMYLFSVAGIPEKYIDIADMVASHGKKMQFCWITAPAPPTLAKRGSRELTLDWKAMTACGVLVDSSADSLLRYVLEGAEGEDFHRGVPPTTLHPGPNADFRVICQGSDLLSATVDSLAASRWYYWRVVYEYAGARFESIPVAINTVGGIPLTPEPPTIAIEKCPGPMLEKRTSVEYKVKLTWPEVPYSGASVDKYLLQVYDVAVQLNDMEKDSMAPGVNSPKSKMFRQFHKIAIDEDIGSTIRQKNIIASRWRTVYCEGTNKCELGAPALGTLQWNFRLRAKNCHGWSQDWVYFFINARSHPAIFPAGKNIDPRKYLKSAPAEKEPSVQLQTQPHSRSRISTAASANGEKNSLIEIEARNNSFEKTACSGMQLESEHHTERKESGIPSVTPRPLSDEVGGKSFHKNAVGIGYDSSSTDPSVRKRPEPPGPPPRELRDGKVQALEQSFDSPSVWMDESSVESEYSRDEKLKKLTDSEVTRVVQRQNNENPKVNKKVAADILNAPFISSFGENDCDSLGPPTMMN